MSEKKSKKSAQKPIQQSKAIQDNHCSAQSHTVKNSTSQSAESISHTTPSSLSTINQAHVEDHNMIPKQVTEEVSNPNPAHREQWSSANVFILAVAGAAIGLSNITIFPTLLAKYGGSAFLILYVLCVLIMSLPMMILEMVIGRQMACNPVSAIKNLAVHHGRSKRWRHVATLSILACICILSFLSVIAGWSIAYMFRMFGDVFQGLTIDASANVFTYLINDPERLLAWHTLFIIAVAYIVTRGIKNGVEKFVKIAMPLFMVILLIMVVVAATTDSFGAGIKAIFFVDMSLLLDVEAVLAAVSMAFLSLGLGRTAIMAFSSYLPPSVSIVRSSITIVALDILVVILAGVVLFPIILSAGFTVNNDAHLIFQILPVAFAHIPSGHLFGSLFFLMLLIAALSSAIALLEPVVCTLIEHKGWQRKHATINSAVVVWLLGLGTIFSFSLWSNYTWTLEADFNQLQWLLFKDKSFFDIVEYLSSKLMIPISAFLLVVLAGHFVTQSWLKQGLATHHKFFDIWYAILHYITPFALFFVLLHALDILG